MHLYRLPRLGYGAMVLLGLFLGGCSSCSRPVQTLTPLLDPLPQDPQIQVFFNQSEAAIYSEPYRLQERRGDNLEQVLVDAIASAQSSVDVAVHELNLPGVAAALAERQQAGIRVRVIMEHDYNRIWSQLSTDELRALDDRDRTKYENFLALADLDRDGTVSAPESAQRDALWMIQQAGIPLMDDTADGSQGSGLMHEKFLVVDQHLIVVGSANFTTSGTHGDALTPESRGNVNHLLRIDHPAIAQLFTQEFNLMWGDGPGGRSDSVFGVQKPYRAPQTVVLSPTSSVTVQFSPTSNAVDWQETANGLIARTLNSATRSVNLALFVFSEQALGDTLQARQRQGVQIRALIDPGFAYRNYSEALDMMGVALPDSQCRYDEGNAPWLTPLTTVGIPQIPEGDVLHHKFGVVDGQVVITGSQNWSESANRSNDENVLIIHNPVVAAHFEREFDRLYRTAQVGVPPWLNAEIQERQAQCQ